VAALGATLTDVRVVTAVMIVLMSFSQFYTQRQLMTKNVDTTVKTPFMQQQKMLMYVFPVMFAVFGINFPVGVLVYWLTTNVWTMGQQMYVIHINPTPGSKAQAAYLERLHKHVTHHSKVSRRRDKAIVKAIVAKGRDRNEFERKFINGLNKVGLAAQADGTVAKSESAAVIQAEDGTATVTTTTTAPRRQQPKRQSKAQRQSGGPKAAGSGEAAPATSLSKSDQPQDAPPAAAKQAAPKPGNGTRSKAQSGQRKGPQRPKSPSKK
jgi:YidC/Oxa1 family membrane protein insertase